MMNIAKLFINHNIILAAVVLLILGLWSFFDRRKDARQEPASALLLTAAFWLFSFVLWTVAEHADQARFWLRTFFYVGSFMPPLYLLTVWAFYRGRMPSVLAQALLLAPNATLLAVAYATPKLVDPRFTDTASAIGDGRLWFAAHFAAFVVAAFLLVLRWSRREAAIPAARSAAILVGGAIAFQAAFSVLFGSHLPSAHDPLWAGNLAFPTFVAGILVAAYAIDKRKFLMDVRPVWIELIAVLAVLAVVINAVVSSSLLDFTLRLVVLVILVFFGSSTAYAVSREIRRLREIEALHDQLVKVNGRLLEADKLKTRFVSFASHQLRAPLGGIRSYLDMLRAGDLGKLSAKQAKTVVVVMEAVEHLADTVDTFLDVAKIELGKLELYVAETNVASLLTKVSREIEPVASKKGLSLVVDASANLPNCACDGGKLYHAVMNLVHNAIKYTDEGGITVAATKEDGGIAVRVSDTGVGLTAADRGRIMDGLASGLGSVRFDQSGGSGLGLFIVKSIVDAHGGQMIVESAGKRKGSTFGFRIPLRGTAMR